MYLSSSGGGSGGPRPSSDLKDDGCPGDRGNEVLLSDVDLSRVGAESKIRSYYPPRVSQGLLIPQSPRACQACHRTDGAEGPWLGGVPLPGATSTQRHRE